MSASYLSSSYGDERSGDPIPRVAGRAVVGGSLRTGIEDRLVWLYDLRTSR
jgi:hypothetical protein